MADYLLTVYNWSPYTYFTTAVGSTFTLTGDTTDTQQVLMTDNETGVDGLTFDDNVGNSRETAVADVVVNGTQYFDLDVNADAGWTLYDPVDNVYFEVVLMKGGKGQYQFSYTLSEYPLVEGRTYEVVQFDNQPNAQNAGDPYFTYADYVCFTAGSRIRTPRGWRLVEDLAIGDLVCTRDHGVQPVRWVGQRRCWAADQCAVIEFQAGAFSAERAFAVSEQHALLVTGSDVELYFGTPEVLVRAGCLVGHPGVRRLIPDEVTFVHLLFERHELVDCEGAWSESLFPGSQAAALLGPRAHAEMRLALPRLFNGLASYGPTARPVLSRREAALLSDPLKVHTPTEFKRAA